MCVCVCAHGCMLYTSRAVHGVFQPRVDNVLFRSSLNVQDKMSLITYSMKEQPPGISGTGLVDPGKYVRVKHQCIIFSHRLFLQAPGKQKGREKSTKRRNVKTSRNWFHLVHAVQRRRCVHQSKTGNQ